MHKFVNPYNFVPFGKDLTEKDKKDKNEIYRGNAQKELLTGWLDVSMSLKTPLILPDGAHPKYFDTKNNSYVAKITEENKKSIHSEYGFMRKKNPATGNIEPVVSGSTMRGMIRSYFEAVSNSCVPFLMNDKPMSQRVPLFGALTRRGLLEYSDGSWKLYDTRKQVEEVIIVPVYEAAEKFYTENLDKIKRNRDNENYEIMSYLGRIEAKIKQYQWNNKPINYGIVIDGYGRNAKYFYDGKKLNGKISLVGYYMVNKEGRIIGGEQGKKTASMVQGKGILQYNLPVNLTSVYHVAYLNKGNVVKSWNGPAKEKEAYTKLKSALKRDGTSIKNANQFCNKALSDALENAANGKGNLVPVYYFMVEDPKIEDAEEKKIVYMSGSAAGRIAQRRKWVQIMDGHTPCKDNLCPACLLFGTIHDGGMKGHIRVSDGFLKKPQEAEIVSHTLQILASPRSTAFEFYLKKPHKNATYWNFDFYGISEGEGKKTFTNYYHLDKATPRGRKMFWHHELSVDDRQKTNMNSTMESLEKGEFAFKVYFDQITKEQLQDLIWVITLGDNKENSNLQQKMGHAKPLGYGSVKLTVDGGKIRKFKRGEQNTFEYSLVDLQSEGIDVSKNMQTSFALNSEEVKSVLKICDANLRLSGVDYPRMSEGRQIYEWFSKNRTNPRRLRVLPKITDKELSLTVEEKKTFKYKR